MFIGAGREAPTLLGPQTVSPPPGQDKLKGQGTQYDPKGTGS